MTYGGIFLRQKFPALPAPSGPPALSSVKPSGSGWGGVPSTPRIPPEAVGLQVNHCKSPKCSNFGVPASVKRPYRRKAIAPTPGDYSISGLSKANPGIKCANCGEVAPMRSNMAIAEEVGRMIRHVIPDEVPGPSCPNTACEMHGVPLAKCGGLYVSFGKTAAGTTRYRCKECSKTFTGATTPTHGQRRSEKNRDVFLLLMNKVPINRIQEVTGLGTKAVYDKIAFIHRKCQEFVGDRESHLLDANFVLPKIYLSVDRQHYVVNWSQRKDRRTVQLNAIGSADIESGYVFGFHLNFDGGLDPAAVEADAAGIGDTLLHPPFRKYARVWLADDYKAAMANTAKRNAMKAAVGKRGGSFSDPLLNEIEEGYMDALVREDIEESDLKDDEMKLPGKGMQVHETYTMYAHFFYLSRLLRNAPKVRVYMDMDSGFRAAFMAAFAQRIKTRAVDGFYVKVGKDANAYQKQNAVASAKARLNTYAAAECLPGFEAAVELMKAEMKAAVPMGRWGDKWVVHPRPIASEPSKRVCWLTDLGDYDDDHQARLLLRATLHPIDRFFMQTRRRVSLAERPVVSVRQQRLMWHGYGAYNPAVLAKYLEIYRVYFNYCLKGKGGKTPAMRLGLAQAVIDPQDILYFG